MHSPPPEPVISAETPGPGCHHATPDKQFSMQGTAELWRCGNGSFPSYIVRSRGNIPSYDRLDCLPPQKHHHRVSLAKRLVSNKARYRMCNNTMHCVHQGGPTETVHVWPRYTCTLESLGISCHESKPVQS